MVKILVLILACYLSAIITHYVLTWWIKKKVRKELKKTFEKYGE